MKNSRKSFGDLCCEFYGVNFVSISQIITLHGLLSGWCGEMTPETFLKTLSGNKRKIFKQMIKIYK